MRPSFAVYLNNVMETKPTGRCAEVGVSCGYNAVSMLSKSNIHLVLVDDYVNYVEQPNAHEIAKGLLASYQDRIQFITLPSVDAASKFNDGHFDYVYIDAGHTYEDVKSDIEAWWPKVALGGMLAGHDFWNGGVVQAVMEAFKDNIVCGVSAHGVEIVPSNLAMMCDWWVFKGVT